MKNQTLRKGFTLIEIVIVLAIAALIMVIVFLAVQGAQRAQRDEFRRTVVNQAAAAFQQYRGNNNGTAPTSASGDLAGYVTNLSGNGVTMTLLAASSDCATSPATTSTGSVWINGNAVETCLEGGGLYSRNSE